MTLAAAVEFNLDLTNKMPKKKLNQDIYKHFNEKISQAFRKTNHCIASDHFIMFWKEFATLILADLEIVRLSNWWKILQKSKCTPSHPRLKLSPAKMCSLLILSLCGYWKDTTQIRETLVSTYMNTWTSVGWADF